MATAAALTPSQRHALFDILTHNEVYAEIEGFKYPDALINYGSPFSRTRQGYTSGGMKTTTPAGTAPNTPRTRTPVPDAEASGWQGTAAGGAGAEADTDVVASKSPLLQMLLTRFVLPLPGVRDLPPNFWAVRVQGLLERLGEAELSESYDKGALGTRKTLATGASAVIEMMGRGALGRVKRKGGGADDAEGEAGAAKKDGKERAAGKEHREYDCGNAEDLVEAWDDVVQRVVYGDLVDQLFDHFVETDDIEGFSPAVKAAVDYIIFHLATFSHQIFIFSPEGQYLLKLLENVHNLIPYKMLKQTLRVGNAATMISGMMRLLLAKLSVTSVTNWFGLTQNADDGMNLLQRIISLVLSWDSSEFKKGAEKVEKAKDGPSEEMLSAIRKHIADGGRKEHELVRTTSMEHKQSIITAIFNASNPDLCNSLTESQHAQCLEYYSALLSVHDREAITTAFCRQPPDLFTQMIKDAVAAYDPIIRSIHSRVELREHLEAMQGFVEDFIRASKPKKAAGDDEGDRMAGVEDYVQLLMKNRGLLYKWIHAVAQKCPDVWEQFREWAKDAAVKFQEQDGKADGAKTGEDTKSGDEATETQAGGTLEDRLDKLYASLAPETQTPVLKAIDQHAEYLSTLTSLSHARLQYLVTSSDSGGDTPTGPGVYLARWSNLLDDTAITPAEARGATELRHGKDVKHATTMGKTGVGGGQGGGGWGEVEREAAAAGRAGPEEPDVGVVVREMGDAFREVVCEMGL